MAVEFDLSDSIKAPKDKIIDYFMDVEDIPKYHPKMARKVEVIEKNENSVKYKMEGKVMLKKIEAVNNMSVDKEKGEIVTDTVDGDGKGSKVTLYLTEKDGRTDLNMKASLEMGSLGSLGKGKAQSMWKDVMSEAKQNLEKNQ